MGLLLLATVIVQGSRESNVDSKIRELEIKVKKLEEQPKQLKIEDINETRKTETVVQQSARSEPVKRVLSVSGNCEQYRSLVSQYSWNVETVLKIMFAESGCNPNSLSRTSDRGLMQINRVHASKVGGDLNKLYDPATNIAVAYQIYADSNWYPWSVCTRGAVKCW